MITLTESEFYKNPTWHTALDLPDFEPEASWVDIFDQNGYRLTSLETLYALVNKQEPTKHGPEHCLKKRWFVEGTKSTGAHLNHAALFERKGYSGAAKEELEGWAKNNNLLYKLIKYKPKWGVDFSIDYVDSSGEVLEIFHFEYDAYSLDEIGEVKQRVEKIAMDTDWEDAAKTLIKRKAEWHHLEFFEQSDWKCAFFGMPSERFKMVAWE